MYALYTYYVLIHALFLVCTYYDIKIIDFSQNINLLQIFVQLVTVSGTNLN